MWATLLICIMVGCIPPAFRPSTNPNAKVVLMKTYNEVNPTGLGQKKIKKRKLGKPNDSRSTRDPPKLQSGWPQSLLDFVNRSFKQANSLNPAKKAEFDKQIQQVLYLASKDGKIWTNQWESQRLPIFDNTVTLGLAQDIPVTLPNPNKSSKSPRKSNNFDSEERKNQRCERFAKTEVQSKPQVVFDPREPIVGTLSALEKRYLRLTAAPDPSTVRPEHVLRKSVEYVIKGNEYATKQYSYINDQLKAIRQDLTVQHIKNEFAVEVYEIHGRIAIENNDLGEFNQCLSQLIYLYSLNRSPSFYHRTYEFQCYRVFYFLITGNNSGVNKISLELLDRDRSPDLDSLSIKHLRYRECLYSALNLLQYSTQGDYHQIFLSYQKFRNSQMPCAFFLFDKFLATKERVLALNTMSKAYKKVLTRFVETELGFENAESFETFCRDLNLLEYIQDQDFDIGRARLTLQTITNQRQFKRVDIKG